MNTELTFHSYRVEFRAPTQPDHTFEPYCAILASDSELDNSTVRVFDVPDVDERQWAAAEFACRAMNNHAALLGACRAALSVLIDIPHSPVTADVIGILRSAIALAED